LRNEHFHSQAATQEDGMTVEWIRHLINVLNKRNA
jgi:hypothetical protein